VIEALQSRDPPAVRNAIQSDMIEGGTLLLKLLEQIENGEVSKEDLRKAASTNRSVSFEPAEKASLTPASRAARAGLRS
jgi:hypothetical protein